MLIVLAKEIMTKNVISVKPEASIRELAETLLAERISGVPVVDDAGTLCGIVSESDLMRKEIAPEIPDELCILGAVIYYNRRRSIGMHSVSSAAMTAQEIMTEKVLTVKVDDDVSKVAKLMLNKHIKEVCQSWMEPVWSGSSAARIS